MNSLPCDIVLLPDAALAEKAIQASQLLQPHSGLFTLEDGKCYPHASLYMFQLNEQDIPKVAAELDDIAKQYSRLQAVPQQNGVEKDFHGNTIFTVDFEKSDTMAQIQQEVISRIMPIRSGMREKDKIKMQDATGLKLKNLQDFGYPSVGDLFHPHFSLSKLEGDRSEVASTLPPYTTFTGEFTRIGLFEMGNHGTCVRLLAASDLKTSV